MTNFRWEALDLICRERERQEAKHPGKTCASPSVSDLERLGILVEEVGELSHELTYDAEKSEENRVLIELVQVTAVGLSWIERILGDEDAGSD